MIKLVAYEEKYHEALEALLTEFSTEVFGVGTSNIDHFVSGHWCIYLALKGEDVIGFTSFIYNNYYGLRTPTVGNDYAYIQPQYRGGKTMYLFTIQAGAVSLEYNLPLETYFATEDGMKLSTLAEGELMYQAYTYDVEAVRSKFDKLTHKFEIKK